METDLDLSFRHFENLLFSYFQVADLGIILSPGVGSRLVRWAPGPGLGTSHQSSRSGCCLGNLLEVGVGHRALRRNQDLHVQSGYGS